jgi:hypothetical protein
MTNEAARTYFKAHGWPTKLDGTLKLAHELDRNELLTLVRMYAITLQTELSQVTVPLKRRARSR